VVKIITPVRQTAKYYGPHMFCFTVRG